MSAKIQQLQKTLETICKLSGDCWNEKQARERGADSWLSIDHQTMYGGYRLERINVIGYGNAPTAIGTISDTCARLKYNEFEQLLRGIYCGLITERPATLKAGQTIVNNNERVFMLVWSNCNQAFCNLKDLSSVVKANGLTAGYYTIYHFWNNKPKKATKKLIKEMLAAHKLPFDFFM